MKTTAAVLGSFVGVVALCWAIGLVEFTYPKVFTNQPLQHPRKVVEIGPTDLLLDNGLLIRLLPRYGSEPVSQDLFVEISNQVSRAGFEVDVEPKAGHEVTLYVRWPGKFRDSAPPFTIPLIPKRVGSNYRKVLTFGTLVSSKRQPERAVQSDANQTSAAGESGR
ncbi:MAG TPA: hypothetical protein VKY92_24625 [Verrucomicrobiae bacterium]|jgi:hypothetical protein|nr:hypothetical protein [Verrucomicrobiae bacterium]